MNATPNLHRSLLGWYDEARRDLPWRRTRDPYAIWVSEIMCQQTRVATVIPYFERWMTRFPTVNTLAEAPLEDVLAHWSGLGYYRRARNLHVGATFVMEHFAGNMPTTADALKGIPGIGAYTAGAIASIAYEEAAPIVDANVARVWSRVFAIEEPIAASQTQKRLWDTSLKLLPSRRIGDWNQALMELGALVCTPSSPLCPSCPLATSCQALQKATVERFPVVSKRKTPEELQLIHMYAIWTEKNGEVLLGKRPQEGLYGGLWELPQSAAKTDLAMWDLKKSAKPRFVHNQVLSHRRLRIEVFVSDRHHVPSQFGDYQTLKWHDLASYRGLGLSSATRNIMKVLWEKPHGNQSPSVTTIRTGIPKNPRRARRAGVSNP